MSDQEDPKDQEWKRWKTTFQKEERPMPNVMNRARSDGRRARLGLAGIYAVATLEVFGQTPDIRHARSLGGLMGPFAVLSAMVLIIVGAHVAMRGSFKEAGATPRELLAAMEKRHMGRLRLVRFMPWAGAYVVAATLAVAAREWVRAGRVDPLTAVAEVGACALVIALMIWVGRRTREVIQRELSEAAEARRMMEEEGSD